MRLYEFRLADCWFEESLFFQAELGAVIPPSVFKAAALRLCPEMDYDDSFLDEHAPWAFAQLGVNGAPWISLVPAIGFSPVGSYMLVDSNLPPDTYGLPSNTYPQIPIRCFGFSHPDPYWANKQLFGENCLADRV